MSLKNILIAAIITVFSIGTACANEPEKTMSPQEMVAQLKKFTVPDEREQKFIEVIYIASEYVNQHGDDIAILEKNVFVSIAGMQIARDMAEFVKIVAMIEAEAKKKPLNREKITVMSQNANAIYEDIVKQKISFARLGKEMIVYKEKLEASFSI